MLERIATRLRRLLGALHAPQRNPAEASFSSLSALSSDWYWEQDAELRFTAIVGDFMRKGNLPVSRAIGKRRWELPIDGDGVDWDAHRATLAARLPFSDFEYAVRGADGSRRCYSARGEPVFDTAGRFTGYRGMATDITRRKQRDEELQRFRAAMDTSADSILLADRATMRFIDANATACRMLGYSREELLTMGPQDVFPRSREQLEQDYDGLIAGSSAQAHSQTTHRRKDGKLLPVEVARRSLLSGGAWIIVGIARDISARLAAEQTIRRHAMQQSLIAAFGQTALGNADLADLLNKVVRVTALGLDAEFGEVLQPAPDGVSLVRRAGVGWDAEPGGARVGSGASAGSQWLLQHGIRSSASVPIRGAGGAYGVLAAHSLQPGHFAQDSIDFLTGLANMLATAMDRKGAERRLTQLAQFDTLTGLANRSLFLDRFSQTLKHAQRNKTLVGVLFIDLDRFKEVNDTLGHAVGDQLLVEVAARLQHCVRAGDAVGRLGGDEFAFALSELARPDDAARVAQKVVATLAPAFILEGQEIYVSASIGIGIYPGDGNDADTLLRNADTAMYRAKQRGRNGYQFYLPQMNEQALERLQLQNQLRGALERHEFVLHYQPKASLASGEISGFEALLRWQHPVRGLVPPLQFIHILEETGLVIPVGEWVLRTVCQQLAAWQAAGITPRPVAVNLSARQFQQRDFDASVAAIVAASGIDPGLLELELTESMLMSDADEAVCMLNTIRAHGVRLSVDDFGTGYSSLAYLKRFPLDALKIDRAFIREVTTDPDDASIALAIIRLAHSLKLKVVAEGVETAAQLAFLKAHGCDEIQGYYLARPLELGDCTRALREDHRLPAVPSPLRLAVA